MANPKNAAPPAAAPTVTDTSGWSKEQIGFDPYWTPELGKSFVATLVSRDDRAMDFQRYRFMAIDQVECQRGPNDDTNIRHERVLVKKGETFNISMYSALEEPLNGFLNYAEDTGKAVTVKLTCTGTAKTKAGQDVWLWDCLVPPATKAALMAWRTNHTPRALAAAREQVEA